MLANFFNIGVKDSHSLGEARRIKLLNQITLIFVVGVFLKFISEILVGDILGLIITGTIITLLLITIFLNKLEYYSAAKIYFSFAVTIIIVGLNLLFGRDFGGEFGFFPLIVMAVVFFEKFSVKLLWLLFYLTTYVISVSYISYHGPLMSENLNITSYYYMMGICYFSVFLMSYAFIKENVKFEKQTNLLLEKLTLKNETLEIANQELEKFAFVASHDLKTPLRNINSFLNLIQIKLKQGKTSEIDEYLEFASLNAQRMHGLIQDILEFSRINNEEVSFENKDLTEILLQSIQNLQPFIKENNAKIIYNQLPKLFCNETQIQSLFQNLIENGIKYNTSKVPIISIDCKDKDIEYQISVTDNGIGIDEEFKDKIFDMFYRLHNQSEFSGSGIGLAICKKITTFHGGHFKVHSSKGHGTTFNITLPKHSQDESLKKSGALQFNLKNISDPISSI